MDEIEGRNGGDSRDRECVCVVSSGTALSNLAGTVACGITGLSSRLYKREILYSIITRMIMRYPTVAA